MKMPGRLGSLVARQRKPVATMLDPEPFLTLLYVTCDNFFQCENPPPKLGQPALLADNEVVILALLVPSMIKVAELPPDVKTEHMARRARGGG